MRGSEQGCLRTAMPFFGRRRTALTVAFLTSLILLVIASSASALTLGVGWAEPSKVGPEMLQVGKLGAETFRVPLNYENNNDGTVEAAAKNGVTVHAEVSLGENPLPTGSAKTAFFNGIYDMVRRYGHGGQLFAEHPSLPYKPITTWEVWNEPNRTGINAVKFGEFVHEAASVIQSASQDQSGHGTDVLFGGLEVWGNKYEANPTSYGGALKYLEEAYPAIKNDPDVTGVAIHPYMIEPETLTGTKIEAFASALSGFHAKLVELAGGAAQKSLWITEAGWPVNGKWAVSESEQANLLERAINYTKWNATALEIKDFLWYNIRDFSSSSFWAGACGLRAENGDYRESWFAFQEEAGAPRWPVAPAVETGGTTGVGSGEATLHGSVDPKGGETTYHFEWGPTDAYTHSTPAMVSPSEDGSESVQATFFELSPHWTYHYRLVASNKYGISYGNDRTFTTFTSVAFVDASTEGQISEWSWSSTTGWYHTPLYGGKASAGSSPSALTVFSYPHVYFSDSLQGNTLNDWNWYPKIGWMETKLYGDEVAAGTSPSAAWMLGVPHVFSVDAAKGNMVAERIWTEEGWQPALPMYGDPVAAGSSPVAAELVGQPYAFFVNGGEGAKEDLLSYWQWTPGNGWQQTDLLGDKVAANTNPAIGEFFNLPFAFFVDATQENTLAYWQWTLEEGWQQTRLFGDEVAAGSSPAVGEYQGRPYVFYVNASKGNTLSVRFWSPEGGWQDYSFGGDAVAPGTSPTVASINGEPHVFFVDASKGNVIAEWGWTAIGGWNQAVLYGHAAAAGTSPSAF